MKDLISIIVPVYNAEKYIDNCVESLLKQTYENFELILVNDGSKDKSLIKCLEWADKDSRVKVYNQANGGASSARNLGLEKQNGDYIVFVDSDDYVSESYLEHLYLAAKSGEYDIVQCNSSSTNEIINSFTVNLFDKSKVKEITKIEALNKRYYLVSVWGKIYSKHIFYNFKFKEGIIFEDDASYYIFVDRANKIGLLNETLYYYFMSENSVMRNNEVKINLDFVNIYEERIKYFAEKKDDELLRGSYFRYCTILMLVISSALTNENKVVDIEYLISLFKQNFLFAKRCKHVRKKDKILLFCFRIFPKITGKIIGKIRKHKN